MKVLVTGAAGFIGSYVARALVWRGDDVVGVDNLNDYYPRRCKELNVELTCRASGRQPIPADSVEVVYSAIHEYGRAAYPFAATPGDYTFVEGDFVDFPAMEALFAEHHFDTVVHLGAMAGVPYSTRQPRLYTQVNVDGTVNLLTLAKDTGVNKFVFASSSSVYGDRADRKVTEDDDVSRAVSIYGASKVAGEVLCHAFHRIYGLPVVIDRIFGPIYGPLQRPYGMFHQRAINYLYNGRTLSIYGKDGLQTAKDSTYIDDQVTGILACLDCVYPFEIFNIGTANPLPIRTWIDAIETAFQQRLQVEIIDVDKADVVSSADISKARRLLDYAPATDMYDGVKRQVEVFQRLPDWYRTMDTV